MVFFYLYDPLPLIPVYHVLLENITKPLVKCQPYHKRKHQNRNNKKRCKNVSDAKQRDSQTKQ